jgi:hypothetical protein
LAGVVTTHCHGDDSELPVLAAGATTESRILACRRVIVDGMVA